MGVTLALGQSLFARAILSVSSLKTSTMITFLVLGVFLQCGHSVVVFDCLDELFCINESVQYQCTANDSIVLRWRIRNENMTSLDTESYTDGDVINGFTPIDNVPQFSTALLSTSPLISNISFTVKSSINEYNISCEDGNGLVESCFIEIYDSFPPPVNVTIVTHNPTKLEVQWTPPNVCVTVSSYSITSNATNSIITTTDTSVDIPLAGLSPGVYCVSVATVDTANRTGNYSNEECVELAVPSIPVVSSINIEGDFTIIWTFPRPIIPPLLYVYIYYTTSPDGQSQLIPLLPNVTNYTIPLITNTTYYYNISVYGHNTLGNGSITSTSIVVSTSSAPSTTDDVSPSVSVTVSPSPSGSSNLVVIAVPSVIAVVILVSVCMITAIMCYKRKKNMDKHMSQSFSRNEHCNPQKVCDKNENQNDQEDQEQQQDKISVFHSAKQQPPIDPYADDYVYNQLDYNLSLRDFTGSNFVQRVQQPPQQPPLANAKIVPSDQMNYELADYLEPVPARNSTDTTVHVGVPFYASLHTK